MSDSSDEVSIPFHSSLTYISVEVLSAVVICIVIFDGFLEAVTLGVRLLLDNSAFIKKKLVSNPPTCRK